MGGLHVYLLLVLFSSCLYGSGCVKEKVEKRILFLGDSFTEGMGVPASKSFPAILQQRLRSTFPQWQVENAGISGDTTEDALLRLDPLLARHVDVLMVSLGINDVGHGFPGEQTEENLNQILQRVRTKYPDVPIILGGMTQHQSWFPNPDNTWDELYERMAKAYGAQLIPFLLEGVAGNLNLNIEDGFHPDEKGYLIIAETVWPYLEKAIQQVEATNRLGGE